MGERAGAAHPEEEKAQGGSPQCLTGGMKGSQTPLMGVQCKIKGNKTGNTRKVHLNIGKYPLTVRVRQQNRLSRQVVEFSHLKIFKIQLALTCKQGWLTM